MLDCGLWAGALSKAEEWLPSEKTLQRTRAPSHLPQASSGLPDHCSMLTCFRRQAGGWHAVQSLLPVSEQDVYPMMMSVQPWGDRHHAGCKTACDFTTPHL